MRRLIWILRADRDIKKASELLGRSGLQLPRLPSMNTELVITLIEINRLGYIKIKSSTAESVMRISLQPFIEFKRQISLLLRASAMRLLAMNWCFHDRLASEPIDHQALADAKQELNWRVHFQCQ